MRRGLLIVVALLLAGCDDKTSPVPTAPSAPPVPVSQQATCVPFDLEWAIERDMASSTATVSAKGQARIAIEFDELDNRGWRPLVSGLAGASFTFRHESRYRVRGRVNNCWSQWFEFPFGPANPNASGDEPVPRPVPPSDEPCPDQNLPTPYPNPNPYWCKQ
jgi:hypothetical protein